LQDRVCRGFLFEFTLWLNLTQTCISKLSLILWRDNPLYIRRSVCHERAIPFHIS
jgi:hypothetical protein